MYIVSGLIALFIAICSCWLPGQAWNRERILSGLNQEAPCITQEILKNSALRAVVLGKGHILPPQRKRALLYADIDQLNDAGRIRLIIGMRRGHPKAYDLWCLSRIACNESISHEVRYIARRAHLEIRRFHRYYEATGRGESWRARPSWKHTRLGGAKRHDPRMAEITSGLSSARIAELDGLYRGRIFEKPEELKTRATIVLRWITDALPTRRFAGDLIASEPEVWDDLMSLARKALDRNELTLGKFVAILLCAGTKEQRLAFARQNLARASKEKVMSEVSGIFATDGEPSDVALIDQVLPSLGPRDQFVLRVVRNQISTRSRGK